VTAAKHQRPGPIPIWSMKVKTPLWPASKAKPPGVGRAWWAGCRPEGNHPECVFAIITVLHNIILSAEFKILPLRGGSSQRHKGSDTTPTAAIMRNLLEIPETEIHATKVERTVFRGKVVFDRIEAIEALDVVEIEITNADLDNAVDAADLDLLVEAEFGGGGRNSIGIDHTVGAGARSAPDEVNGAFASLSGQGYRFARPARTVYWKTTGSTYWIQWTVKDDAAVLWAYDPESGKAVRVLRVKEK